jgi:hypothetical protein
MWPFGSMLSPESKITAVDICFNQKNPADFDADDEESDSDGSGAGDGVQEIDKKRWNLNASFQDAPRGRDGHHLEPETYDVINSRFLADGIDANRWPSYIRDLRRVLKPRGWVQMIELIPHIQSENGRLGDDSHLTRWWLLYSRALQQMGKQPRVGRDLEAMLRREGFDPVQGRTYNIPIGKWSSYCMFLPSARSASREAY